MKKELGIDERAVGLLVNKFIENSIINGCGRDFYLSSLVVTESR